MSYLVHSKLDAETSGRKASFTELSDTVEYARSLSGLPITGIGHYRSRELSADFDVIPADQTLFRNSRVARWFVCGNRVAA